MKDSFVLKKLFLLSSFLTISLFADSELSDILSKDKNQLLDYQKETSDIQTAKLEKSWINPIMLQYSKSYSSQFSSTVGTGQFLVSVDQPIFKMGGIWAAMKYAKALGEANNLDIELQRRQLITQGIGILFNLQKSKLQLQKLDFMIQNDELDIQIQKESYDAGLSNRTLYDQALLKRNQDITSKLEIELSITKLENDFSLISDREPYSIELPNFGMIDEVRYNEEQLELNRDRLRIEEKEHNRYMTLTKYLPELSVTGRYINEDLNPLFARSGGSLKREYYTYGFKVTLPLSINSLRDIESSKIEYLNAKIALEEKKKEIANNFKLVKKRLEIIDKKIELSEQDAQHYASMQSTTQDMESIGDATTFDIQIVTNSLNIRQLDQDIYKFDAQLELLSLYSKVSNAI